MSQATPASAPECAPPRIPGAGHPGVTVAPRLVARGLRGAAGGPFDLSLPAGSCLAVTGPSGAGKSVLLRMIADLDPNEGEVLLDGLARSGMPASEWRRRVAYAAAEPAWWHDDVGAHFATPPLVAAAALALPVDVFARPVRLCSTGERQRLALLRTLAAAPAVLLLDEPTGALDAEATARVEALLRETLRGGAAMLLVTHDPAQAARMGDAGHHRLRDGRLLPA